MLKKEEFERYTRQIKLDEIGIAGQVKIKQSKVCVVGAGGLGTPALLYLNAVGVGTIGVVDFDQIELSNLHRQILYSEDDVGKSKALQASVAIEKLNPHTKLKIHEIALDGSNAQEVFKEYDVILDGCDNFSSRYVINDTCVTLGKPLIYGSILGFDGQLSVFNNNGSKNLRDIFPNPPKENDIPNCAENGVLGTFPGIIGTMMAQETIKLIIGLPVLNNELLIFDTLNWNLTKLNY